MSRQAEGTIIIVLSLTDVYFVHTLVNGEGRKRYPPIKAKLPMANVSSEARLIRIDNPSIPNISRRVVATT